MSYPARDLGISLHDMQHLPALSRRTPKNIGIRTLISRIVAPWILSLLVAIWQKEAYIEKGAGIERPQRVRLRRKLMPARSTAEKNRYGAKRGRHQR
jgi:hypothetical protein